MAFSAVVLSGGGRFSDPWHPFSATSQRLADIIGQAGGDVVVDDEVDERLLGLDGVDLIVVNAAVGASREPSPDDDKGLRSYLARGGGVLAVHTGVCGLAAVEWWSSVTGARWIDGQSGHPPLGPSSINVLDSAHVVAREAVDFDVFDERYTALGLVPPRPEAFLGHSLDGETHPLMWARLFGAARVVCDALGHGVESYDSAQHVALIARSARWAAGQSLR